MVADPQRLLSLPEGDDEVSKTLLKKASILSNECKL